MTHVLYFVSVNFLILRFIPTLIYRTKEEEIQAASEEVPPPAAVGKVPSNFSLSSKYNILAP